MFKYRCLSLVCMSNELEARLGTPDFLHVTDPEVHKKASERTGFFGMLLAYFSSTIPGINILAAPYVVPKLWGIFRERRSYRGIRAKHAQLKTHDPVYRALAPQTRKMKTILVERYGVPEESPDNLPNGR